MQLKRDAGRERKLGPVTGTWCLMENKGFLWGRWDPTHGGDRGWYLAGEDEVEPHLHRSHVPGRGGNPPAMPGVWMRFVSLAPTAEGKNNRASFWFSPKAGSGERGSANIVHKGMTLRALISFKLISPHSDR